jgi:hypothetical protein
MSTQHHRNNFYAHAGLALILYLALSAIKMRRFFESGRFWAEEGAFFYRDLSNASASDAIFYLFNGHIELMTNLIVYSSTLAKIENAPLITTHASMWIQATPVLFLIWHHRALSLSFFGLLSVVVLAAGIPQASEVWANAINVHFHCSILAALIAATPVQNGFSKWVSRILLVMAGMSGIPANFLVPLFLWQAFKSKDRERWIHFSILSLTAIIQLSCLALSGFQSGDRSYLLSPWIFWLAPVMQSIVSPMFGVHAGDQIAKILLGATQWRHGALLLAAVLSAPLLALFYRVYKTQTESSKVLLVSASLLTFMSLMTALGDKQALVSAAGGGRYFYAPNFLLAIVVFSTFKWKEPVFKVLSCVLLASCLVGVWGGFRGPAWEENFSSDQRTQPGVYRIWPEGWVMDLNDR